MKKLVFFIPAIIVAFFYGLAALGGMGVFHPIIVLWLALLWIAGVFLSKTVFWGGLLGFIPGACFIYMGLQETGQIFKETLLGVVMLLSCFIMLSASFTVFTKRNTFRAINMIS